MSDLTIEEQKAIDAALKNMLASMMKFRQPIVIVISSNTTKEVEEYIQKKGFEVIRLNE